MCIAHILQENSQVKSGTSTSIFIGFNPVRGGINNFFKKRSSNHSVLVWFKPMAPPGEVGNPPWKNSG